MKNNTFWCHKVVFTSVSIISLVLGLEYKYSVLPIHGITLIVYLIITAISTAWITFACLQKLLQSSKPFRYDSVFFKRCVKFYSTLQVFVGDSKSTQDASKVKIAICKEGERKVLDDRIDDFIHDVEKRFIQKWYIFISNDPTFPLEAKVLLDAVVRHFLQVVVEINAKELVYSLIIIFLKHIKEFRRTLRRSSRSNATVEDLFRYSHIGSKSDKSFQHFVHQLTANVLRQFINWELWNSLPCRTLVAILSRKLTRYILTFMSTPGFLNYQIMKICTSDEIKLELKLRNYSFISISDIDHSGSLLQIQERPLLTNVKDNQVETIKLEDTNTPAVSPKKTAKKDVDVTQVFDQVDSPRKGLLNSEKLATEQLLKVNKAKSESRPKPSEPVKIHESKSANKTWRNSSDLECISLGQDLLAFQEFSDPNLQIQELIDKKLWKDTTGDEKPSGIWELPESWYGEEENSETQISPTSQLQNYLKSNATTAALITNTMKPLGNVTANTLHNMKELQQSTVNTVTNVVKPVSQATTNAMHKIGDLQDEAAGVVEGILDFGMAGLRKGLRLTGLQENISELTQKAKNEFQSHKLEAQKTIDLQKPYIGKITEAIKIIDRDLNNKYSDFNIQKSAGKLVKIPRVLSEDKPERQQQSSSESDESFWVNPLNNSGSPSFEGDILLEKTPDSLPKLSLLEAAMTHDIPQITEDIVEASPDLEYEEAQDFASTIAKLRYLLQQKSSESSFTTPAISPMPQEELSKTPADPPSNDITKADGAMPSLYKFCARTATGVFQNTLNTIKTALPGNVNETNSLEQYNNEDWTFVEADSMSDDFYSRMKRLLSERRAYCTVDTAYEAIDSLDLADKVDLTWTPPACQFDDDMDEFDLQVPITKALVDIVCELISDSNTYMLRESVVKAVLLLIGNYTEDFIDKKSESLLHLPSKFIGKLPENVNQNVLALKLEEMVKICADAFPDLVRVILGDKTVEIGLQVFISSLQSPKINQDLFMQILELFASQLIMACGKASPAYSA